MLDKVIYEFMLDKHNDETINTQSISFDGNYVFVRYNDNLTLQQTSTYNSYDTTDKYIVAMAETTSDPTDFVEANNRTGWVKTYSYRFDIRQKEEALEAMQEVFLYFRSNNTHEVIDDVTYKLTIKPSRPKFEGSQKTTGGTTFIFYSMIFKMETIETGYYDNEVTHKMSIQGGTLQDIIKDIITVNSATSTNPSNKLTTETNTLHKPVARGVSFQFKINYDATTFQQTLRKTIEGKLPRTQIFTYEKKMPNETADTWDFIITEGNLVYQSGVLLQLAFNGVESA